MMHEKILLGAIGLGISSTLWFFPATDEKAECSTEDLRQTSRVNHSHASSDLTSERFPESNPAVADSLIALPPSSASKKIQSRTRPKHLAGWGIPYGHEFWRPGTGKTAAASSRGLAATDGKVGRIIDRVRHAFKSDRASGGVTVDAGTYRAAAGNSGIRFAPRIPEGRSGDMAFEFQVRTHSVSRGDEVLFSPEEHPHDTLALGNTIQTLLNPDPQLVEHLEASERGVEISWILSAPGPSSGNLRIEVQFAGAEFAGETESGYHFADGNGIPRVRMSEVLLVDADLNKTTLPVSLNENSFSIELDDSVLRSAKFPIVIDPVLSPQFELDQPVLGLAKTAQFSPSVAAGPDNFMVVWQDKDRVDGFDIFAARITPDGTLLDPGGLAVSIEPGDQTDPVVAAGGDNFLIVWSDPAGGGDLRGARINGKTGERLNEESIVISDASGRQDGASVAALRDDFLVVWQDYRNNFTRARRDIYGTRIAADGRVLDPTGLAISTIENNQNFPAVASDGTQWFVVWHDLREGDDFDIYGTPVSINGDVLDEDGIPISIAEDSQWNVSIAHLDGEYLVVWQDRGGGLEHDIFGVRIDAAGRLLDDEAIVVSDAAGQQTFPVVSAIAGNYLVVWDDARNTGDFSNRDIYGTRIDSAGGVLDPEGLAIGKADMDQREPSVAGTGTGFLVVWEDIRGGNDTDIYGNLVTADGGLTEEDGGIPLSTIANEQRYPAIASNGQDFLIAWQDFANGEDFDIHAVRVSAETEMPIDEEVLVISAEQHHQERPFVISDGADYLVVWQDFRNGIDFDVFGACVSGADGSVRALGRQGAVFRHERNQLRPRISRNDSGFLVVWQDERIGSNHDVFGIRLDSDGAVIGRDAFEIVSEGTHQRNPFVDGFGREFLVAWEDARNGNDLDIFAGFVTTDPEGATMVSEVPVSVAAGDQRRPAITHSADGFLILWEDHGTPGEFRVQGRRFASDGILIEDGERMITSGDGTVTGLALASNSQNHLAIWQEQIGDAMFQVRGGRLDRAGNPQADPQGIDIVTGSADELFATIAANDIKQLIAYQAYDTEGAPRVAARFLTANLLPVIVTSTPDLEYLEGGGPVIIDDQLTVIDADNPNFEGGTLTVGIVENGTRNDRLAIRDHGNGAGQIGVAGNSLRFENVPIGIFTGGQNATSPLLVIFNSSATLSAVQALARAVTFSNLDDPPLTESRTIQFVVNDGVDGISAPAFRRIKIVRTTGPPLILQHPKGRTVSAGETVTMTVETRGSEPLAYQWQLNEMDLAGENQATLVLRDLRGDQAGRYRVIVSNAFGEAVSDAAEISFLTVERCITWTSVTGQSYYLEGKVSDSDPVWRVISETILASGISTQFCVSLESPYNVFRVQEGEAPAGTVKEFIAVSVSFGHGEVCLSWAPIADRTYSIEGKETLADPDWDVLESSLPVTFPEMTWCTSITAAHRFFRVAEISGGNGVVTPEKVTIGSIARREKEIVLSWVAKPNHTFQVQYSDDLSGPWVTFAERAASNSEDYEFIDDDAVAESIGTRFYRVVSAGDFVPDIVTIGSIERGETGIVIRWTARANQSFEVQYRNDLFGAWLTFEERATSNSESYEFIDEDAINSQTASRYYRVVSADSDDG